MAARMPPSAIYREGLTAALFEGCPPALVLVLSHLTGLQLVERAPPCREGGAQLLGALRLGVAGERPAVHGLAADGDHTPVDAAPLKTPKSPKRRLREAARELSRRPVSTKSQQALSEARESQKKENRARRSQAKREESEERFERRQQKKKQKRKGH